MDRRPGVAYRRPDGDPTQFTVEAAGESRLNTDALPQTDWLRVVEPDDRTGFATRSTGTRST